MYAIRDLSYIRFSNSAADDLSLFTREKKMYPHMYILLLNEQRENFTEDTAEQ